MRLRGLGRLRHKVAQTRDRIGPKAVILLYHRVAELQSDPWGLAVSPGNFAEQLDVLRKRACVVSVGEVAAGLRGQPRAISGKVAITFDDGYADNLFAAKPLIEEHQLPTTIYMTSGSVGRMREFWWDELDKIFLQPGELPEKLELQIAVRRHDWTLSPRRYSHEEFAAHGEWRAETDDRPTERQRLYRGVYDLVQGLSHEPRESAMNALAAWSGASSEVRPTHRALSPDETCQLADSEWIEIGAHTVTHQALSTQPAAVQCEEIIGSKEQLQAVVGRPVRSFSYPYGLHSDETVDLVRRAGFDSACACMEQVVRRSADPFRLPRLYVGNWPGDVFAAQLDEWLKQ